MILVLDPDLLHLASQGDITSQRAVEYFARKLERGPTLGHEFAIDREGVLGGEYAAFLAQDPEKQRPETLLADYLMTYPDHRIRSRRSPEVQDLLDRLNCTTPVEPELIGMASNAPRLGLTIIMSEAPGWRRRGLHQDAVRKRLRKVMSKLDVRFASETEISFPALEGGPRQKTDRDILFEKQVENILREFYCCPHCYLEPPGSINEVDVYGYDRDVASAWLWIAECKLRTTRVPQPIQFKEVRQLQDALPAVCEYEQNRSSSRAEPRIQCFVASNAEDMEPAAWRLAASIGARFLHARIAGQGKQVDDWEQGWHICEIKEYLPEYNGTDWQGRLVRSFMTFQQ